MCVVVTPLLAASADGETWVRVLPAGGSYAQWGLIEVEVWIEDVEELYGADVRLTFDATRLEVLDADPPPSGSPGVQLEPRADLLSPDFVIKNEANNGAGTIWYAATQLNPTEAVSGSGAIVAFTFQTKAPGTAVVDVSYWAIAKRDGTKMPAEAAGAMYQIRPGYRSLLPLVVADY